MSVAQKIASDPATRPGSGFDALRDHAAGLLLPAFDAVASAERLRETFRADAAPYWQDDSGRFLGVAEGRAWRLEVGLGTVALRSFSPAATERRADNLDTDPFAPIMRRGGSWEHAERHAGFLGDAAKGTAQWAGVVDPGYNADPSRTRRVSEWSYKSRSRMLRAFAELDYRVMDEQPGIAAMVTLTYPGPWQAVVPTADDAKRHLRMLLDRYARAFGFRPAGLWKQEFQRRGAPHYHLFIKVQALAPSPFCEVAHPLVGVARKGVRRRRAACECWSFEEWLSWAWADIVDHPDPEHWARHVRAGTGVDFGAASNCTDGKRLAVYFLKHGTKTTDGKEYQNKPPPAWDVKADAVTGEVYDDGGTGRFWGYWGMVRARAVIDVPMVDFFKLRRLLRASRSRVLGVCEPHPRHTRRWGAVVGRRDVWGLGARGGNGGGWALVNDGPAFAELLSRALRAGHGGDRIPIPCPRRLAHAMP